MSKKLTTEEFVKRAKEIHGGKYDYSLVDYKGYDKKIKIICPTHGVFEQSPDSHLRGQACPVCGKEKLSMLFSFPQEQLIKRAKEIHGDKYDYSLVDYKNNKTKIKIICPIHGIFEQVPINHLRGHGCPKCACSSIASKKKLIAAEEFTKKAKEVHGDKYDYSLVDYKKAIVKVKIVCPKHGVFEQSPDSHLRGSGCPICNESHGEKK